MNGVELVVSDGHKEIQAAVSSGFLSASWQMCQVHFSRAVMNNIPNRDKEAVAEKLRRGFEDLEKMKAPDLSHFDTSLIGYEDSIDRGFIISAFDFAINCYNL